MPLAETNAERVIDIVAMNFGACFLRMASIELITLVSITFLLSLHGCGFLDGERFTSRRLTIIMSPM
jgi:hypothetical protein